MKAQADPKGTYFVAGTGQALNLGGQKRSLAVYVQPGGTLTIAPVGMVGRALVAGAASAGFMLLELSGGWQFVAAVGGPHVVTILDEPAED